MNTPSKIKSIEEFTQWVKKQRGTSMLYRGLANCDWEVEASAYCRINLESKTSTSKRSPLSGVFQESIRTLLNEAKSQELHKTSENILSDLQLLTELQHHGAATCLIDFTEYSMVALWFACNDVRQQDGKVIAMNTDDPNKFSTVSHEDMSETITKFFQTKKQWKWKPDHSSNRIAAQKSAFVFGKEHIDKSQYESVLVDKYSKESILKELKEKFAITEQYLFRDLPGFAQANAHDKIYSKYTAENYLNSGLFYIQQYEFKKSEEQLGKAIELDPNYADAYYFRGYARNFLKNYPGAIGDFNKAIELYPRYASAYHLRGRVNKALGNIQKAEKDFMKAKELGYESDEN